MLFKRYIPYTLLSLFFLSCTTQKETAKQTTENTKVWGIDISHYQEVFDWDRLKEHEPGFIFVKATEGTTIQDSKYAEYYKAIRKLDIPVGSYHFFTYKTSGKDQAKNFLSTARMMILSHLNMVRHSTKRHHNPKNFAIKGRHNDGIFISGRLYVEGVTKFFEKYNIIR